MCQQRVIEMMGGSGTFGRQFLERLELAEDIVQGLPARAASSVREYVGLTPQELATSLGVSRRTLQRREAAERLRPAEGERLYRLARLAAFAEAVLEDPDRAHRWLREPQRGLGNRVPLDVVATKGGARMVEDLLGRIEHGVFA